MKKSLTTNDFLKKSLSILLSISLVLSFLPIFGNTNPVQAEEAETTVEQGDVKSEEEILESADGVPVSQEEATEIALKGGVYSLYDRSNVNYNVKASGTSSLSSVLPSSVDLRNYNGQNRVTSVKNQDSTGTCWSFAANAASETNIATSKNQSASTDYSPFQTAYFAYDAISTDTSKLRGTEVSQKGEGLVWVSNELKQQYALNCGGTSWMASSMFLQGSGPATAASIPFPTSSLDDGNLTSTLSSEQRRLSVARLSKWSWLGSLIDTTYDASGNTSYLRTNETVLNRMKTELASGKAVEISYWAGSSYDWQPDMWNYYNYTNNCQYTTDYDGKNLGSNHAVCVVGYDDNYSKTNFNSWNRPSEDGAFIVKNSWGLDSGQTDSEGYFYISYWDQSITDATTYEYDTTNYDGNNVDSTKEIVDQYDYTSAEGIYKAGAQWELPEWYSNVYTATYNQKLHSIGTYYCSEGKTLSYKVYKLKSNATSPKDVADTTPAAQGTYNHDYEGFVSIKLSTPVDLKKGDKYAIMFSQTDDDGIYCAPQSECYKEGKTNDGDKFWDLNAVVNSGESFYYGQNSSSWKTISNMQIDRKTYDNYCVKGYSTVQPYKVTFMSSGYEYANRTAYEGETVSKPTRDPEKTGNGFIGWYKDENCTQPWNESDPVTEDMTIYAKFSPYSYYVFFYSNGGSYVSSQYIEYNSYATEPDPAPTKNGSYFAGWYAQDGSYDGNWGTKFDFDNTRITGLINLYAKWSDVPVEYIVTFKDWNGTTLKTQTVQSGNSATAPSSPTRTGYTFTGWDKSFTNVTSNMTVTAQYKINSYKVSFNSNGGSAVGAKTVNYNSKVTKPTDPTRVGYTFGGWYTDSSLKTAYNFNSAVTKAFTLYAKWTQNVTKLEMYRLYNPNSGEHFYTSNSGERDNLKRLGWVYEGVGWVAPKSSKTPVHRLYNPNAGDHHYTTSDSERDMLKKAGWVYEGVGWYSDDSKSVPLYRQYNPNAKAGSHNFTTSEAENKMLISYGWVPEGIAWYGMN